MVITPKMADFIKNEFFTSCNGIKFIEWENSWNVVFDEAQILGGIHFEISKEEFKTIFPDFTKTLAIEDDKEIERE